MTSTYTKSATQVREWRGRDGKYASKIAVFRTEDLEEESSKTQGDRDLDDFFGPRDAVRRGREYRQC